MSDENPTPPSRGHIVLGLVVISLLLFGLLWTARAVYRWFVPPPPGASISLSAYFDGNGELLIQGRVQQGGVRVEEGQASITVNRVRRDFRQSFLVPIGESGGFGIGPDPALRELKPADELYIEARAWSKDRHLADEEVYLKASKPAIPGRQLFALVSGVFGVLVVAFLWTFTGNQSDLKNRLAIACSYLAILVYLSAPLLLPIFLRQSYPDVEAEMRKTPVGLVEGITAAERDDPKAERQWYLNIGGVVVNEPGPAGGERQVLTGGLAVPFFILVLSCLGGAINMTRKVPEYHDDALRPDPLSRFILGGWRKMRRLVEPTPVAEKGETARPEKRPKTSDDESEDEWWRVGLIKEYMYLISAPFLAIVTYYLLLWLDLTQKPVIVLGSFAVGLISDQIVERIIKVVQGLLRSDAGKGAKRPAGDKPDPS